MAHVCGDSAAVGRLHRALSKLDVVSRDEFDTQQAVLMRTRERLEALEKRVSELEAKAP